MINMANTRKNRVAKETRSQVARRLVNEAKRIEMRIRIVSEVELVTMRQVIGFASDDLQDFIGEKFLEAIKEWKKIIELLENQCDEEEYKEYIYNEAQKIVREEVSKLVQEREEENRLVWRLIKENTICFICNEKGHKARDCTKRVNFNEVCGREIIREKSDNMNNSSRENDRDERKRKK
ncbi:hypothetical protein NGRA_3342 [Nosema granulosis]|uniref:CCHC-type domain-containing protein n=1 Tax=Nosema granulosis TaxID=83296 RepID=A0A9P6KX95_9MICR|nr:hypothetical protein NGRA_3342 [Nosema granulosis]